MKKQIDVARFRSDLPDFWERLRDEFDAGGEAAFDARNKFHINNLRLQYPKTALPDEH